MAARFVYFDVFQVFETINDLRISNGDAFFFLFLYPKRKSVVMSSSKIADVFKLNDEKRSYFLINEIFQVAMFLQWNLIVGHPKIF